MSATEKRAGFSLKLSHQGLLLVAVLLAIEFIFVSVLFNLLTQAEMEARSQERYRKIIAATNRLIELNYVAVYAVRDFVATKDTFHEKKYMRAIDEMKTNLSWLEDNLHDESYQLELVGKIRKKFNVAFDVADRAREVIDNGGSVLELAAIMKSKGEFQHLNRQLVPDFQELLRAQRRLEEKSPELQRQWRDQSKQILALGMILNVVIAIAMAAFFTRGIIKRLEVLIDNTKRLKEGENLRPVLSGNDEIARLDKVFHEMAFELTEASRKERMALADAKEAESRIRQVINAIPTGILTADRSGTILFANPRVSMMFDYTVFDLKGMHFSKLLPSLDLRRGEEGGGMPHLYDELKERSLETRGTTSTGNQIDIELSITPFDIRGEKRFLITLLDITEKLEVQRMRQAFVAMVSHELRTPLNSVQGYLELLEMGALGEVSREARDGGIRASANIERLITLINDLLDLEKIESGTISLERDDYDVMETIEEAVSAVSDLAEKNNISISVSHRSDVATFNFDQDRIVQVLINFLSNALKYTPNGGTISISTELDGNQLIISVIDEGPGIPDIYRDMIFERFQQVKTDGVPRGGTGLGLAICKAIVLQHKGSIGVTCENPKGSRFWFKLRDPKQSGD